MRQMEREAAADRELLSLFLEHYRQIGQQQAIIEPDAKVVSYAKPPAQPSSLDPKLFTVLGFTISVTTSAFLAILVDALDRRVRSARQIERHCGLRVLGAIPLRNSMGGGNGALRYIKTRPHSFYAEALRLVYTGLEFGPSPPQVLQVSSALSGEGKTTLVIGLATVAARAGKRVIAVDFDLRHPSLTRAAGVWPTAGLVEVVTGEARPDQAIVASEAGFDCIGVLLPSQGLGGLGAIDGQAALIDQLRRHYDLVILDTSPVLAVADARITARLADGVVMVARWGQTSLSAVRRTSKLLHEAGTSVPGVVLSAVDQRRYYLYENEDGFNFYSNLKKYYDN